MPDCTLANSYELHDVASATVTVPNVVVGAGEVLIAFSLYNPNGSQTITSVTWNGSEAFSLVAGLSRTYMLTNPTAGTHSVVIVLSASPTGRNGLFVGVLDNYGGVRSVATGSTATLTQTLTTVAGDLCLAALTSTWGDTNDLSPASGSTSLLNGTSNAGGSSAAIDVYVVDATATGTSTTIGWQVNTQDTNRARKSEYLALQGTGSTSVTGTGSISAPASVSATGTVKMTGTGALTAGGMSVTGAGTSAEAPPDIPEVVPLPSSLVLPGPTSRRTGLRLPATLVWRSRDLTVNAATGQAGTLVRSTQGAGLDVAGRTTTVPPYRATWTMLDADGDTVVESVWLKAVGGTAAGDLLQWPFTMPALAEGDELSCYLELFPGWSRTGGVTGSPGLLSLGGTAAFAADGKAVLDLFRDSGAAQLVARAAIGSSTLTLGSGALPANASEVLAVLLQLRAQGSSHQLHLEVGTPGSLTITATSGSVIVFAGSSWRSPVAVLNSRGNGDQRSDATYRLLVIARGRRTAAELAALA